MRRCRLATSLFAVLCVAAPTLGQSNESSPGALAILIRNPDSADGAPPYALADQFGTVRRLVEPTSRIDLAKHVGRRVRIKHDTGDTLLASQLELPELRSTEPSEFRAVSPAQFIPPSRAQRIDRRAPAAEDRAYGVVRAQAEESLDEAASIVDDLPGPEPILNGSASDPINLDELPAPSVEDSLETLPSGQYYEEVPTVEPIPAERVHAEHNPAYSHKATTGPSECDCPKCQPKASLCDTCGRSDGWCGPTCNPPSRRGVYGRAEYLLWWFDGMATPPLATTNDLGNAPVLGTDGTRIVYGGELLDENRNGLRLTLGAWLDDQRDLAIEGDWTIFETDSDTFFYDDPAALGTLGRPFYNVAPVDEATSVVGPPTEDAQLIARPGQIGGTLTIQARSQLESLGLRLRTGICCREIGGCGPCGCEQCSGGGLLGGRRTRGEGVSRVDVVVGYRWTELEEQLLFQESLRQVASGATLGVNESFETNNNFHGLDLGFIYEWQTRRWGLELLSKIALGSTNQRVTIAGSNTIGAAGAVGVASPGGLLAQTSNIGSYERDRFSVLPELSARLSYRITPRLSLSAAYTLMYWANVVRPGDQIDFSVDGRLVSPALVAATPSSHPRFQWNETSLWAHGFNFGLDYAY